MKKLIGVILITLTLLLCIIYRHLANHRAKARPDAVCRMERLQYPLLYTLMLLH